MAIREADAKADTSGREGERWEHWFEVVAATVLGLAALASTWSAYQSALWNGIQTFRLAASFIAARRAVEKAVFANQLRTVDVFLFEEYVSAAGEGNQRLADFLFQRFRPEMKTATEAWLATHWRIPPPRQRRSP